MARRAAKLPSKSELLEFINDSPSRVGKREIARAFHIGADQRVELKALLREMAEEGLIERGRRRRLVTAGSLPPVAVIEITAVDEDGDLLTKPAVWDSEDKPPPIRLRVDKRLRGPALGKGDRVLARLTKAGDGYAAKTIRRLPASARQVLGQFMQVGKEFRIQPVDRRQKYDYLVAPAHRNGAAKGELVLADVLPGQRLGLREARVVERLGQLGDHRSLSLIAIHASGLPISFSEAALAEAKKAKPVTLGKRTDLRDLPLVTIDGADARDFDDAVWAAADDTPGNKGGWKVIVAIADVAHYVRPDGALDRAARARGNSVYFPDRVIPMLPEELSNDLCSLREGEDRPVLAVAMWFDRNGHKQRHEFMRALIRSVGRLTYTQVQAAQDGAPDDKTGPLLDTVIRPLFSAYRAIEKARDKRQPLALDLPERQVILDDNGNVEAIRRRERLDSHRLIEDFMIAANVCAAETLEQVKQPCMYRVHAEPDREKVRALKDFLHTIGFTVTVGEVMRPALFNRVLLKAQDTPHLETASLAILRSQMQAAYDPANIGHFGLALRRYAHFTSPIRRYADLLVHRALIAGLRLGAGGLSEAEAEHFAAIAEQISNAERRAMEAERDAVDRFVAAFMSKRVGANFAGRVAGVTRAGLFVSLDETGADGLVPISTLGPDYYIHDEERKTLTGEQSGEGYRLGDKVEVRLLEATPVTGGLIFEMLTPPQPLGTSRRSGRKTPQRAGRRPVKRGRKR